MSAKGKNCLLSVIQEAEKWTEKWTKKTGWINDFFMAECVRNLCIHNGMALVKWRARYRSIRSFGKQAHFCCPESEEEAVAINMGWEIKSNGADYWKHVPRVVRVSISYTTRTSRSVVMT
jgi:hypothetical protein